jgi:DNA-binding transcriptional regulator YdaS (Cro superfamily)
MVPSAPFAQWLAERRDELGSYAQLARRIHMNPDNLSQWLRGTVPKTTVRRATVDRALEAWGDGTTFKDLYRTETQR